MRSMSLALAAAAAMIDLSAGSDLIGPGARAGEGQRRKPGPAYVPKVPKTAADFERLRVAEAKRARKAAELARQTQAAPRE